MGEPREQSPLGPRCHSRSCPQCQRLTPWRSWEGLQLRPVQLTDGQRQRPGTRRSPGLAGDSTTSPLLGALGPHLPALGLSFQTFQSRSGDWYEGYDKHEFTFRDDEFDRLLSFLNQIQFVDLSNRERFSIQDISTTAGPKAIIDASDRGIVERVRPRGRS